MENSEKMMGAMFGSTFKCCMCDKTHSSLTAGYRSIHLCYAKFVDRVGIRSGRGRHVRKWSTIPSASFSYSVLGKTFFPELGTDETLELTQFKHCLAANSYEDGCDLLNRLIQEWRDKLTAHENELLSQDIPVPPFTVSLVYGLSLEFGDTKENKRSLSFTYKAALLGQVMQDNSLGAVAFALLGNAHVVDVCWKRLPEPLKLLVQLRSVSDDKKGDESGCYLLSKKTGLRFIPVVCKTVVEAEERLS